MKLPEKTPGLLSVEVGDELLVYDPSGGKAHALSSEAAAVFRVCGQEAAALPSESEGVLASLSEAGLIQGRRTFLKTASAVVVSSLLVPRPAAAVSSCSDCTGSPANCAECTSTYIPGPCEPCSVAGKNCADCECMAEFQVDLNDPDAASKTCADDTFVQVSCVELTGRNAGVQQDCAAARAFVLNDTAVGTPCGGTSMGLPAGMYCCCSCSIPG